MSFGEAARLSAGRRGTGARCSASREVRNDADVRRKAPFGQVKLSLGVVAPINRSDATLFTALLSQAQFNAVRMIDFGRKGL